MSSIIKDILNLCLTATQSDFAFILKLKKNRYEIPFITDKIERRDIKLDNFCEKLIEQEDLSLTELQKIDEFTDFSSHYNFKYAFITQFTDQKERMLLLIFRELDEKYTQNEIAVFNQTKRILNRHLDLGEKDLSGLLNDYNHAAFICNTEGRLLQANAQFDILFEKEKFSTGDIITEKLQLFDSNGDELNYDDFPFIKALRRNEIVQEKELRYNLNESNYKWLRFYSTPIKNDEGKFDKVISSLLDVTDIVESRLKIKRTLDNLDSIIYSADKDGKDIQFFAGAFEKIFGYKQDLNGKLRFAVLRRVNKKDIPALKNFREELKKKKNAVVEYQFIDFNGKEKYLRHTGIPVIQNDEIIRYVGVISDITEEKSMRKELEKSEEKFRILLETANNLIFSLDNYGYFKLINKNGAKALSYTVNEMRGKHFLQFVAEEDKSDVAIAIQNLLHAESVVKFEASFVNKFGHKIIFEIQAVPTKENNEINGMLGIGRNITDRIKSESKLKELNNKLIEANRIISIERDRAKDQITMLEELNRLKNEFVSNVSHEL